MSFCSLVLSTIAFSLHFFALDHHLKVQHPFLYHRFGRWLLVVGILLGWVIGYFCRATGELESLLFAFMAGTVIVNSIKDEIPSERGGRFFPLHSGAWLLQPCN